jgi:hypothetical protein
MPHWIDDHGAQIRNLHEHGKLWVFERLPYISCSSDNGATIFQTTATVGDGVANLVRRWWLSLELGPPAPEDQYLFAQFHAVLRKVPQPVALIVRDAHLLSGGALNSLRLLTEWNGARIAVLLEGDVSAIDMATRKFPSFYQRAAYCVEVNKVF